MDRRLGALYGEDLGAFRTLCGTFRVRSANAAVRAIEQGKGSGGSECVRNISHGGSGLPTRGDRCRTGLN